MNRTVLIGMAAVAIGLLAVVFVASMIVRDIVGIMGNGANPVCDRTLRNSVAIAAGQSLRSPSMTPAQDPQIIVLRSPSLSALRAEVLAGGMRTACAAIENRAALECRVHGRREFTIEIANSSPSPVEVSVQGVIDRCGDEASGHGAWTQE